jgi:2',3'-cyclic-nucleotide 2'-phosphodiesterase (5'-nucleotidase family)
MRRIATTLSLALVLAASLAAAAPQADVVRVHLLWTNDLHGHIAPEPARFMNPSFPPPLGGAASAATYIKRIREEAAVAGEPVLLMDVGDMFQGTPIGNTTEGAAVIEYFNLISYDFAVPGNHDFDLGRDVTERLARQSNFPWLSANVVDAATSKIVDWLRPTLMLDLAGVKVGVIGITTPATARMSFPDNIAGLEFRPMPETIARCREELRAQGAELIVLAIHEGLPYDPKAGWAEIVGRQAAAAGTEDGGADIEQDQPATYGANASYGGMNLMELVNLLPGIDVAIGGHTHRGYEEPWIDPVNHTLCFESFGNGSSLGHAILRIDRATGTLIGWDPAHDRGTLITLFEDEIGPDAEVAEVLRPYVEATQQEMARPIGETAVALTRGGPGANLVGNVVTDAMREHFDADFAFVNLGGLRADLPPGPITAGDLFSVMPFQNELVVFALDGRLLRRIIEAKVLGDGEGLCVSGVKVAFDPGRPDWDKVVLLEVGGQPWSPDAQYTAVCTNFLLEGNSGLDMLSAIPPEVVTPTQVVDGEAVERYIMRHSPLRPALDSRWTEQPGAAQAPYLAGPYLP